MGDESAARPENLRQYAREVVRVAAEIQSAAGSVKRAQEGWEHTGPDFGRWTGTGADDARRSARRWQDLGASVDRVASAFVRADDGRRGLCPGSTAPESGLVVVPTPALAPYLGLLLPTNTFGRLTTAKRIARARADARRLLAENPGKLNNGKGLYAALRGIDQDEVEDPVYAATLCNELGPDGFKQVLDALGWWSSVDPDQRPIDPAQLPAARLAVRRLSTAFAVATHTLPDADTHEGSSPTALDGQVLDRLLGDDRYLRALNALLIDPGVEPRADIVARAAEQLLVAHPWAQRGDGVHNQLFLRAMAGGADTDRPVLDRLAASPAATTAFFGQDRAAVRAVLTSGGNDVVAAEVVRTGLITASTHPEWGYRSQNAEAGVAYLVAHADPNDTVGRSGKRALADLVGAYPQLFGEIARDLTNEGPRPVSTDDLRRYFQLVVSDHTAGLRLEAVIAAVSQTGLMARVDAVASTATAQGAVNMEPLSGVAEPVGALASHFEVAVRRDRTHHSDLLAAFYTVLGHTKDLAALGLVAAPLTAGESAVLMPVSAHAIDAVLARIEHAHPADTKGTSTDVRHDLEVALRAQVTAALLSNPGIAATVTTEGAGGRRFFERSSATFLAPGSDDAAAFDRWLSANPLLESAVSDYIGTVKASWAFARTGD